MAWDSTWDTVFKNQSWGKYPSEPLIRLIAKNFYNKPDHSQVKILEVGPGTGANLWYCAREGFSVYGVDGSDTALKIALNRLNSEIPNWKGIMKIGDVCKIDFNSNMFDCVIDIECLCCLKEKDVSLASSEIYRILKPGGIFISRAFGKSTIGYGTGKKVEDNTFICDVGPLKNKGSTRFIDLEDIERIYPKELFKTKSIESITYTLENRTQVVQEWIIEKEKNFKN